MLSFSILVALYFLSFFFIIILSLGCELIKTEISICEQPNSLLLINSIRNTIFNNHTDFSVALEVEGIFRRSGNIAIVKDITQMFNKGT